MACSYCGGQDHNIQTCPSVRRCSVCRKRGHDRRNCPEPRARAVQPAREGAVIPPLSGPSGDLFAELHELCAQQGDLLAHLYWSKNDHYFENSRQTYARGRGWQLKATPGHGVSNPPRPTLNFFVADEAWALSYASAAGNRAIVHGIMLRRAAIERLARQPGFEFAEICAKHPNALGVVDPQEFWKFDVPSRRFGALHDMRFAKVARLATPEAEGARWVNVPSDALVAWW